MTHSHTLSATIARAIFDRIERDKTLILQNIEEVIRDQLAIEGAKRCGDPVAPRLTPWGTEMNEYQRQAQKAFEGEYKRYPKPRVDGWYA